jgi:hypothetical protein
MPKGKGRAETGANTGNTGGNTGRRRRRRCDGDVVNLVFNPTTDAVTSVFVAGSIQPCSLPPITPTPPTTPAPAPTPAATAFISCLIANGFEIEDIVALSATSVLVTLVRC